MSFRLLAFFSGLTLGDYLLWNWSLSDNRDVLALVSGLTLPPLAAAFVWLLVLSVARLVARSSRRTPALIGRWLAGSSRARRRLRRSSGSSAPAELGNKAAAFVEQSAELLDNASGSPKESPASAPSSSARKLAA